MRKGDIKGQIYGCRRYQVTILCDFIRFVHLCIMRTCIILLIEIFTLFGSLNTAAPIIDTPINEDALVGIRKGKDLPRAVGNIAPVNLPVKASKCVNPPKSIAET